MGHSDVGAERRDSTLTSSLIDWAQTQNDPCGIVQWIHHQVPDGAEFRLNWKITQEFVTSQYPIFRDFIIVVPHVSSSKKT